MQSRNRNRRRYRGGYLSNDVVYATVIWSLAGMAGILAAIWLFTIAIRSENLLNSETEVARLNSLFTDEAAAASAIVIPTGATCTGGGVFQADPSNTPDYTYEPSDGAYSNPTYSPTATCNQLLVYVRHPGTPGAANPRANDRYLLASFANGLLTISSASSVGTNQEPINPTVLQTIPVASFAVHAVPTTEFANPNDLFTVENEAFLANKKGAFAGNMASVFASIEAHGLHPSVHTVRYAVPNTILTASNTGYFIFGEFNKNKTEPFFGLYGLSRLPATGVIDAIGTFTPPPQSSVTLGSAGLLYFGKPGIAARALTIAEQNYHGYWEVPPSGVACAGGTTGSGGGSITQYVPPYPTGAPYPGASPLPTPPQPRPYAYPAPNDASNQNAPANLLIAPAQPGMCQANLLSVYGTTLLPAYIVSAPLAASSANLGTLAKSGAVATLTKSNDGFPINASVTAWSPASCASAITATAGANSYSNGAWPATPPAPNQTYAANGLLTVVQPLPSTTNASQGMTFTPTGTTSAALACTATVQTTDHDGTVERTTIAMTAPATVTAMLTWPAVLQVGAGGSAVGQSGSTMVAMVQPPQGLLASLPARVSPWLNSALGGGIASATPCFFNCAGPSPISTATPPSGCSTSMFGCPTPIPAMTPTPTAGGLHTPMPGSPASCFWSWADKGIGNMGQYICPSGATAPPPPAIIPGNCYAKALTASGTPDTTISGMPAAEQTALDSALGIGGFGVDNTGCIMELNIAANAWEPAPKFGGIVYEPSGTPKTFNIYSDGCTSSGYASTGAWNPVSAQGAQALLGIKGGSSSGTCAIDLTDGSTTQFVADAGQVTVQTLLYPCDAIGGSCTTPTPSTTGISTCGPYTSGGAVTTVTYGFSFSGTRPVAVPVTTGTITRNANGSVTFTRTGSGTVYLATYTSTATTSVYQHNKNGQGGGCKTIIMRSTAYSLI